MVSHLKEKDSSNSYDSCSKKKRFVFENKKAIRPQKEI